MASGMFRERITIQSPPTAQNKFGEVEKTSTWIDFLTTRASFEPLYGRELFTAEQAGSQVEVRFRIRYREGIQSKFRLLYRGELYEVLYPIDVAGKRTELLLYCKKVT